MENLINEYKEYLETLTNEYSLQMPKGGTLLDAANRATAIGEFAEDYNNKGTSKANEILLRLPDNEERVILRDDFLKIGHDCFTDFVGQYFPVNRK